MSTTFWDDPKVMDEPATPQGILHLDRVIQRLRSMPEADGAKAARAIDEMLDKGYYLIVPSKSSGDTPTYVRQE